MQSFRLGRKLIISKTILKKRWQDTMYPVPCTLNRLPLVYPLHFLVSAVHHSCGVDDGHGMAMGTIPTQLFYETSILVIPIPKKDVQ